MTVVVAPFLSFRIGGSRAALPLGLVREVLERPAIVPVPGSHPHVAGVTLRGGVAVPVYDLLRFDPLWPSPRGGPTDEEPEVWSHLIVCGFGEVLAGLLGEQADLIGGASASGTGGSPGPAGMREEFVSGLVRSGADELALLDPARLFASLGVPAEVARSVMEGEGEEDPAGR